VIEIAAPGEMRQWSRDRKRAGRRVGFVPTMGFLHEGHLRLVDRAARLAEDVVVSIYVNPLQFGPGEDFARYPRDLARDRAAASGRGASCLFLPATEEMYPREPIVRLTPGALGEHLCGPRRPGHFEGVLTVVAKLFHMVEPDVAVFGRKDAQQSVIVRRMVADLSLPLEIVVAPIVREADGLALSSRNAYLSGAQRAVAPTLSRALQAAHEAFAAGETAAAELVARAQALVEAEPQFRLEYVEAVDPERLEPVTTARADTLLALAARLGPTRLIDNIVLGRGLAEDDRLPVDAPGA
jgi:pantoate--beta-alanine ligase